MSFARGADFSSAQTLQQVSAAVHAHGLAFALVKASEGDAYLNPLARAQISLLEGMVVRVGLYHFLTHDVDGARQWDHFETTLHWPNRSAPIVACDQETDEHGVLVPDAVARAFIRRGQQRGYKVGRYGDGRVMGRTLGEDWRWSARWAASPPPGRWDVWQFSDGGGRQDWNVFHGDENELAFWWVHYAAHKKAPVMRWWIHDELHQTALGPLRLAQVPGRLLAYAVRHPTSGRYELVRK